MIFTNNTSKIAKCAAE